MTVDQQTPQTIVIEPANPQVVYVPEYNPAVIYGYPYVTPGYTAGEVAAASALTFGAGIAVGAMLGDGGWGWHAWGCDWSGGAVLYNHGAFYGNAAWHGGYVGGYHPYARDGAYHPYGDDDFNRQYNRNEFNRSVSGNTVNVNRTSAFSDNHFADANSWAQHDNWAGKSNAFSGLSARSGGFGGWSSRADSARGWGSMHASGFSGFRSFGGFHGGGFGGFHGGGGFRR